MLRIKKDCKISLVELPPTLFGDYDGDPGYDIYGMFRMPARAIHVLESILRRDGWSNVMSLNPFYHGRKGSFTPFNESRIFSSDVLCLSSITRTSPQTMHLGRLAKRKNSSMIVIAGGFDPTFRAEEWLRTGSCDIIVRKEGERTFPELMARLAAGARTQDLADIRGISYMDSSREIVHNPDQDVLEPQELGSMPHPYYDDSVRKGVTTAPLETSRSCPGTCNYCSIREFYGKRYRVKPIEYVLEELKNIRGMGKYIFITDDNFPANPARTIGLLDAIADSGIKYNEMGAQSTVDVARHPKVIEAMKKANVKKLFLGVESTNDATLKSLDKLYDAKQNKESVAILRKEGFWIHGMLMVGGDHDTPETLREMNEWANENLDSMQLFAITPIPGTPLWADMQNQDRILTKNFSLYDGSNVVCRPNPEHFTPYTLQKAIYDFYFDFYSPKNMLKRFAKSGHKLMSASLAAYVHLFGGKRMIYNPQAAKHLEFLKSVSR